MKNGETVEKSPREDYEYTFKWKAHLSKISDTVSTSTMTADSGITIHTPTNNTDSATVWVSGGQDGCKYKITNKIVTAAARTFEGYFFVKVIDPDVNKQKAYS